MSNFIRKQKLMNSYVDGATHEGVPLVRLHHDLEQIWWTLAPEVIHLGDTAGKIFQCLARRTSLKVLIGTHQPGANSSQKTYW